MAAKKYRERAIITTRLNPAEVARTVARTGLITEAQPFTPQAQGTRTGSRRLQPAQALACAP
ncbi:hypothetical protein CEE35_09930 [Candidatus Aerophobetes bacterium Ae_b3b]|nr:MAG: hypothetical protein CEE35_09930 [Candidatus Aerophobetes bacterium Ae_b3b]